MVIGEGYGNRFGVPVSDVKLTKAEQELHNLIYKATITQVNYETGKARAQILGELITPLVNWIETRAGEDVSWNPPSVGEQVLVLSMGGDLRNAIILRGYYSGDHTLAGSSEHESKYLFSDGTLIKYNKETHKLSASVPADGGTLDLVVGSTKIEMSGDSIVLTAGGKTFTLNSSGAHCSGNIEDLNGTMQEMRTTFNSHTHPGDSGGTTGAPNQQMT